MDEEGLTQAIASELRAVRPMIAAALDAYGISIAVPAPVGATEPVSLERPPAAAESEALADLDATDLLAAFHRGDATPVDAVAASLSRIAGRDTAIGAIWATDPEASLAAAEESTARWRRGDARPLEGVPLLVKDVIDTRSMPTTGGSRWLEGRRATADASCVDRVRRAGAVVIAKAATFELACGDEQIPFGVVHNPWDPTATTGGSSAGCAAALAARYAPLALGTDTGGSIRLPSAYCGVTGLKPTIGLIDTAGVLPLSPTLDTVGPMAVSARDVAVLLGVLSDRPRSSVGTPGT